MLTIKTDNKYRDFLYWYDLTSKEQREFNHYIDTQDKQSEVTFFRYRKNVYDLNEFMRIEHNEDMKDWHGYSSDSFFSGILVKYNKDCDMVKVGTYYS